MEVNILSTGSKGNCTIIDKNIVIDLGITRKAFKEYLSDGNPLPKIAIVTHKHSDHCKESLLKFLYEKNVLLIIPQEINDVVKLRDVEIIKENTYVIDGYEINTIPQKHYDLINYALTINKGDSTLLYATDLDTLDMSDVGKGINHLGQFDTILMEGNYDEDWLTEYIHSALAMYAGEDLPTTDTEISEHIKKHYKRYPKEISQNLFRAMQNKRHLSKQKARIYVKSHLKPNGVYYEIHRSEKFYEKPTGWALTAHNLEDL